MVEEKFRIYIAVRWNPEKNGCNRNTNFLSVVQENEETSWAWPMAMVYSDWI